MDRDHVSPNQNDGYDLLDFKIRGACVSMVVAPARDMIWERKWLPITGVLGAVTGFGIVLRKVSITVMSVLGRVMLG